jgi:hypothetical protein
VQDDADRKAALHGKLRGAIVLRCADPDSKRAQPKPGEFEKWLVEEGVAACVRGSEKPWALLDMRGSWMLGDKQVPTLIATGEDFQLLERLLAGGEPVRMELDVRARFTKGPVTCFNAVGEIRGSGKPDEIVVCGAHLDSWDLATGATDDGFGCAVVLEVARLLKALDLKPQRTIRFVLFGGEEEWLIGSHAYVAAHSAELPRMSAALVLDTGPGRIVSLGLNGNPQAKPVIEKAFAPLRDLGLTDFSDFPMGATDHASFEDAGVPGFWFGQQSEEYGLTHHSQADTFDKVKPDNAKQAATVTACAVLFVADLPELTPRRARGDGPGRH